MLPSVARLLIRPGSRVRIAFVCMYVCVYVCMYVANASGMQSNVAPAWPCLLGALLLSGSNSAGFLRTDSCPQHSRWLATGAAGVARGRSLVLLASVIQDTDHIPSATGTAGVTLVTHAFPMTQSSSSVGAAPVAAVLLPQEPDKTQLRASEKMLHAAHKPCLTRDRVRGAKKTRGFCCQ